MYDQATLIEQLGNPFTNRVTDRLHSFSYIPAQQIESLVHLALNEEWGQGNYVLLKYLAVHIPWSIEQGRYTSNGTQLYLTAGHLQTRYGTPIFWFSIQTEILIANRGVWLLLDHKYLHQNFLPHQKFLNRQIYLKVLKL